jgi:hypothetical protein
LSREKISKRVLGASIAPDLSSRDFSREVEKHERKNSVFVSDLADKPINEIGMISYFDDMLTLAILFSQPKSDRLFVLPSTLISSPPLARKIVLHKPECCNDEADSSHLVSETPKQQHCLKCHDS